MRGDDYASFFAVPAVHALVANGYGSVDTLRFEDLAVPDAGEGEILIRVAATSLNPVDLKMLGGELRSLFETAFPYVPGVDLCGTVVALGPGVHEYAVGDRVGGAVKRGLAQYARAEAASPLLARVPDAIGDDVAAAAPVVGVTGLEIVRAAGDVRGKTVVVIGASGGVGNVVVQRFAALGAHVIGTARDGQAAAVRRAGANETIDHTKGPVIAALRERFADGVDVLVDLVDVADGLAAAATAVRRDGMLISTLFGPAAVGELTIRYIRMDEPSTATTVADVYAAIARGELRIPVGATYSFAEATTALRGLADGSSAKIVVRVRDDLRVTRRA